MKRALRLLISIMLVMAIVLPATGFSSISLKSIKLDKSTVNVIVGQTYKLKIVLTPANTTQKRLSYATDNKGVATVDAAGNIKGISKGKAVITVYGINKVVYAKCTVVVSLDKTNYKAYRGKDNVTLRFVRCGNTQDAKKDRILLELQKRLNITLDIVSIPWDQFPGKLDIMLSSGDQVDMFNRNPDPTFYEFVKSGLLYDYESLLAKGDYPMVKATINAPMYEVLPYKGKHYGKPLAISSADWGMLVRTDWLKNVGLSMPKTIEDLYKVIKAFKNNDPDKNGKNDTYGAFARLGGDTGDITTRGMFGFINRAFAINAMEGYWVKQGTGITRWDTSDACKQGALFIKKLLDEDLINKDFATMPQDTQGGLNLADFANGKFGFFNTNNPQLYIDALKEKNPKATVDWLPPVSSSIAPANSGHSGGYWWVTAIPKTSKNPGRVLDMLEYGMTAEGRELMLMGIKGIHWTNNKETASGRVYTINKEECDKDWNTASGYTYPLSWGFDSYHMNYLPISENSYDYDKAFANAKAWLRDDQTKGQFPDWGLKVAKYSIRSPILNTKDPRVYTDASGSMHSIYIEGWLKSVYAGSASDFDKNWSDMVKKYNAAGGKTVIEGGNAVYTDSLKK